MIAVVKRLAPRHCPAQHKIRRNKGLYLKIWLNMSIPAHLVIAACAVRTIYPPVITSRTRAALAVMHSALGPSDAFP